MKLDQVRLAAEANENIADQLLLVSRIVLPTVQGMELQELAKRLRTNSRAQLKALNDD